jgi:energy-coupling factor transport system ATP-binding protein
MTALELIDISFSYDGKHKILDHASLSLPEGAVASVSGKSGCGKSTLAMIACGVIPKAVQGELSGKVLLFGEDSRNKEIYETADTISMVFQDPESQLFAPAVADEVAFAPENLCFDDKTINERIGRALETVGMGGFGDHAPDRLSGGQKQLIALASILSLEPKIIILDEVASQVDTEGAALLRAAVSALKAQGKTVLIIEHGRVFHELCDIRYDMQDGRLHGRR